MRAPGPGQLFGLSRCSGAATQAQSRPHRPRGNRSTAPRFAPGNTCSRGDSEDTRGSCWRRYQIGLDGAGPPPPSAPPPAGGGKRCKGLRSAAGISLGPASASTLLTRPCQHIGLAKRIEIPALRAGMTGWVVGGGGRNDGVGGLCKDLPARGRALQRQTSVGHRGHRRARRYDAFSPVAGKLGM